MRTALALFALAGLLFAQNFRLYLKDGNWHEVREYQVQGERVRYYSVERSDWEELPRELVDLEKTESERKSKADAMRKQAEESDAEEKYERELEGEISRVPVDAGVYLFRGGKMETLKLAELKVEQDKKKNVLKAMSPIPLFAGKATLEIDGLQAAFVVTEERPEFYFRLAKAERFGLARLKPRKNARVVEVWNIIPVSKEIVAERDMVETFRRQFRPDLYKIWPQQPLPPGEYAWIEYTENQQETMAWDFTVKAPVK